ncbi:MAG: hypothetical protein RL148_492 [Planctomycetota bacterium]|jgi:hypothetical protein
MLRTTLAVLSVAASLAAQDHYFPLGFANAGGPPTANYPVARIKDNNMDGVAMVPEELHAFLTTCFHTTGGTCFMTDGDWTVENGEPAFYFTDSEQGRVVRGSDSNHNGVLDASEVVEFFYFGTSSTGAGLFAPDTLGVYRDPVTNQTRVYVALDNSTASSLGFTRGIHRLVDLNNDGDAKDPGEQSLFVASSLGLQVPGATGPVTISRDFWRQVRVLPTGKVLAFAQGASLTGVVDPTTGLATYTIQPDMNAWYGFTDNNGVAVPEVWFNGSTLNNLPRHPDFASGVFPSWDIQHIVVTGASPRRSHFGRFVNIAPANDPAQPHIYYIGASYRTSSEGDFNLNGQNIGGLIYRVVDANRNGTIDTGELSLYSNISGQVHAGVQPVTFTNLVNATTISTINSSTWGMSATTDGGVHFLFDNGGPNDAVVSIFDTNTNGVIDQGEVAMRHYTAQFGGTYPSPYNATNGPFLGSMASAADGVMPGPFRAGILPIGDGCATPTRGLKVVMDAWMGSPQVGNNSFTVGAIRGLELRPAFVLAAFNALAAPQDLTPLGLPGCFNYLVNPQTVGFVLGDSLGRALQPVSIPNNPALAGLSVVFQVAVADGSNQARVPFYTTNALQVTIQP